MSYSFIDRYCKLTANISGTGIVTLIGWITLADEHTLLMLDEYNNPNLLKRENLLGSVVILEEQKPKPNREVIDMCGVGMN